MPTSPSGGNLPAWGAWPMLGRDDELAQLGKWFANPNLHRMVVVHGPPGVRKTALAHYYASSNIGQYPGGVFLAVATDDPAAAVLQMAQRHRGMVPSKRTLQEPALRQDRDGPPGTLDEEVALAWHLLGKEPTLVILDNVLSAESLPDAWLPPAAARVHLLVTTQHIDWSPRFHLCALAPLKDRDGARLLQALTSAELVSDAEGERLSRQLDGLPQGIVPAAGTINSLARRGRRWSESDVVKRGRLGAAARSFEPAWRLLDDDARAVLWTAALGAPDCVDPTLVGHTLGWTEPSRFELGVARCVDGGLLVGGAQLRVHRSLQDWVLCRDPPVDRDAILARRRDQLNACAERIVDENPRASDAAQLLAMLLESAGLDRWAEATRLASWGAPQALRVGAALEELQAWHQATEWISKVLSLAGIDALGPVSEEWRGAWYILGWAAFGQGAIEAAKRNFEIGASVAAGATTARHHDLIGRSLHGLGRCWQTQGDYARAREHYLLALDEKRQRDLQGRVDHRSIGITLHAIGSCWQEEGTTPARGSTTCSPSKRSAKATSRAASILAALPLRVSNLGSPTCRAVGGLRLPCRYGPATMSCVRTLGVEKPSWAHRRKVSNNICWRSSSRWPSVSRTSYGLPPRSAAWRSALSRPAS
ncbi:tetratricopeptide repeat protein [Sorangium sp. So ce854]|uniref:tetratricopeptide repeat protein n=1 Tax=Sorangium sp. So ce854 TaxID=3133322 RepID=UPI003F63C2DC